MIPLDNVDFKLAERIVCGEGTIIDSTKDVFDTVFVRLENTNCQMVDDDSLSAIEESRNVVQRQVIIQRGTVVSRVPKVEEKDVIIENVIRTKNVEIGLQFDFDVRTRSELLGNLRSGFSPIVILDPRD